MKNDVRELNNKKDKLSTTIENMVADSKRLEKEKEQLS